jgi:hypothetical protein
MHRRLLVVPLAIAVLAACGSSDTPTGLGGGGGLAPGVYTLQAAGGLTMPAALGDSTILSGELTVTDSTWSQITVVQYAAGGSGNPAGDTLTMAGGWVTQGPSVTLFDYGNTTRYTGTFTGSTIDVKDSELQQLSWAR